MQFVISGLETRHYDSGKALATCSQNSLLIQHYGSSLQKWMKNMGSCECRPHFPEILISFTALPQSIKMLIKVVHIRGLLLILSVGVVSTEGSVLCKRAGARWGRHERKCNF